MKVLITNVFGKYNTGDLALFNELISMLKDHDVSAIVRFPTNNNQITEHRPIGKVVVKGKLKKTMLQCYYHVVSALYLKGMRLTKHIIDTPRLETLNAYKACDLIISCPGGFIEDSNNSYWVNLMQLYLGIIAGKKIVIAPQSIGPIKSKMGKRFAKYVLSKCDTIFVRESVSEVFTKKELKLSNVEYSPDLALVANLPPTRTRELQNSMIYCTVVRWKFPHSVDARKAKLNYKTSLIKAFRYLFENHKLKLTILNQVDSDLPLAREIVKEIPDIVSLDENNYSPSDMIEKIGSGSIFIGTRFHSCIFAFLSNTPFVAISYLPKTTGMLNKLGLDDLGIPIDSINPEKLILNIENLIANKDQYVLRITKAKLKAHNENIFSHYIMNLK